MSVEVNYIYTCDRCKGREERDEGVVYLEVWRGMQDSSILGSIVVSSHFLEESEGIECPHNTTRIGLCSACRRSIYFKCKAIIESGVQL